MDVSEREVFGDSRDFVRCWCFEVEKRVSELVRVDRDDGDVQSEGDRVDETVEEESDR